MGTDGKTTTSVKDANGHVNKEVTNEAGLTESTTDLGDGEEQITTAYSYDTNGNKIRETYADGGYKTFDYDRKNRLIKTESYEAGEAGESIGEKTLKTVYSYDINDRLLESIDYQIDGAEETAIRYTEYQYDSRGQTTGYAELSQENEPTADEIKAHQIRYHYDSDGKLTKVTYPTTKNGVHALSYEYDQNGRLTKTVTTDHKNDDKTKTVIYTYDKVGNRTKEDDGTTQTVYTYNGLDQLQIATKEKGTAVDEVRQYSYDANGNQTDVKNTKTGQTESYTYDAENRLSKVSVTDKDGKTAVIQQNRYNGDGQRIQKVEGSKTTNYYYQDGVVSYTTDGENSQTSQNLIGTDGNILATQRYGSDHTDYLLYHKDIQGSTTSLVKEDGSVDATYRYTDFGETMINGDNKAENEVCYTAGIYDQSTGLYYLNARYYDPEDGRFVTEDSYRGETNEPDTQNLYVYCADNPVNYVDPSGHKYDKDKAINYAHNHYLNYNKKYNRHPKDCTNFVSQCVHAGGKKMKYKNYKKILQYKDMYKTTSYWYSHRYEKWRTNYYVYKWKETSAWVGVEDFCKYWRKHEAKITVTSSLNKMQNKAVRGDVVQFYVKSKGWYHSTIVTAGKKGALRYCAHSNSRRDYKYSLLTKNNAEKYRIIHFK